MSSLMNYLFNKLDIKLKTVAPYNISHYRPNMELKSLPTILMKHLRSDVAKILITSYLCI